MVVTSAEEETVGAAESGARDPAGPLKLCGPVIPARVITVSDRCSKGEAEDLSGPLAARLLAGFGVEADVLLVPDDLDEIRAAVSAAIEGGARLVLTTGGTGLAPRDITPEACAPLLSTRIPGLEDAMRRAGADHAPAAALSRGLVGVSSRDEKGALIVNAPGSTGGVKDAVGVIGPILAHILDQLGGGDHPR